MAKPLLISISTLLSCPAFTAPSTVTAALVVMLATESPKAVLAMLEVFFDGPIQA